MRPEQDSPTVGCIDPRRHPMHRTKIAAVSVAGLALVAPAVGSVAKTPVERAWKIALTTNREGDSEIYSMNADGTNVRRLTHSPKYDGAGTWSPDGRKLLFYSQRTGGEVWVMNADGSRQRNLSRNRAWDSPGTWSPDGRKILFTSNRDGNNELYVMNADGTGQRILSPAPSSQEWAGGWSPDGRRIAFSTDRDGNWEIYVMNADGSKPRNITHTPTNDGGIPFAGAAWSTDGRILFASTRDTRDQDDPELYSITADGSDVRRLTRTVGIEGLLSISPDASKLAIWRNPAKPRWAFFVMNANGTGMHKVTWSLPPRSR
jgi:Tol biopolymer transport system component